MIGKMACGGPELAKFDVNQHYRDDNLSLCMALVICHSHFLE
jgi:hypothetical protein